MSVSHGQKDLGEYQFHSEETITFQITIYSPVTITDLYPATGTGRFCEETLASQCAVYGVLDVSWNISVGDSINASESNPFTVSVTIHYTSFLGEYYGSQQGTPTDTTLWVSPHFAYDVQVPPPVVIPPEQPPPEQPPETPPASKHAFPTNSVVPYPALVPAVAPIGISALMLFLATHK